MEPMTSSETHSPFLSLASRNLIPGNMRRKQSEVSPSRANFRDRIEMLLSAQTFVGQVLVSTFPVATCAKDFSHDCDAWSTQRCLLFPGSLSPKTSLPPNSCLPASRSPTYDSACFFLWSRESLSIVFLFVVSLSPRRKT